MEPIEDWMKDRDHSRMLKKVQTFQMGRATVAYEDPTWGTEPAVFPHPHPEEDCFEVGTMRRDELLSAPDRVPPPLTATEQVALDTFMNMATAVERGVKGDAVVLPEHYARFKIEPIRFCIENNLNGFQFNIIKYTLRYDAKNGLEDLKKARRYLDMFIKFVDKDPDWWRAES